MCGIAGLLTSRGWSEDQLRTGAISMAEAQSHRGPDDEGCWGDPNAGVGFAFRRLAIVDLSAAGHQPMHSASGRFVAIFNGEVYNHDDLRAELRSAGFGFRGHSDTEVILAAFEHWGIMPALKRFVGMFAIAVWDRLDRRLTLIRDRLGIKPLHIYRKPGIVAFGSELKSLVALPGFKSALDQTALTEYLRYLYIPAPRTIFESVTKLRPGHVLEIADPAAPLPASTAYWSAHAAAGGAGEPFAGDQREAVQALDALLRDAVGLRMVADVPVGALLSGGVDSSTVVALMQAQSTKKVRTYTIGFDTAEYDEARHAAAVAAVLQTDHTELLVSGDDAMGLVPAMAGTFDEPLADPSLLPTFLVCKLARHDVTVALTGDGGDEVFGGYNRYVEGRWLLGLATRLPAGLRRLLGIGTGLVGRDSADARSFRGRVGKINRVLAAESSGDMYRSLHSAWLDPVSVVPAGTDAPGPFAEVVGAQTPTDLVARMQLADQLVYLPDDLLNKVDRASMAVSLEARVPLLDHRVVEFAGTLPRDHHIRGRTGKWILRQVLYQYVPRQLIERPKMGFSVPLDRWLRGPLRGWCEDLIHSRRLDALECLDADAVRRAWQDFQAGRNHRALAIWAVVVFLDWHEHWISNVRPLAVPSRP